MASFGYSGSGVSSSSSFSPPQTSARTRWRNPRSRSRIWSWVLCGLILAAIVFWPSKSSKSSKSNETKRKDASQKKQEDPALVLNRGWSPNNPNPNVRMDPVLAKNRNQPPPFAKKAKGKGKGKAEGTEHVYRPDGLLEVNPKGRHPILELIETSETQWKRKIDRQSRTLKDAVKEYRRRYKRSPPKSFEVWWDYATYHNVQLLDEYDSIHQRLLPFWGIDPAVLRTTQAEWESHRGTFTIGKRPGGTQVELLVDAIDASALSSGYQRAQDQLELLEEVEEWLPEFRATFSMHDGPMQFVSWHVKKKAEEAAERGEYINITEIASQSTALGWAAACPPTSPIQDYTYPLPGEANSPSSPHHPSALTPPTTSAQKSKSKPKSFIYNHRLTMSPCTHPTHLLQTGLSQFHYSHQFGPSPAPVLVPTFSISVSPLHADLLTVAPEQWVDLEGDSDESDMDMDMVGGSDLGGGGANKGELRGDKQWQDKPDERLLWRGSNTGVSFREGRDWNISQRVRLVEMATRRGGELRVLLPKEGAGVDAGVGYGENMKWNVLNSLLMDVAFIGSPIQCQDSICDILAGMFEWRKWQTWEESWEYKYIMDVDGNGWSARFKRLLSSNSLIFKATVFPEWYTERIMPWVHYVPVQVDYSDLYDVLVFFRGGFGLGFEGGGGGNDALAEKIASAGKEWSRSFWRKEDMTAYMFRLFLEYARLMSLDREAMSFKDADGEGWHDDAAKVAKGMFGFGGGR